MSDGNSQQIVKVLLIDDDPAEHLIFERKFSRVADPAIVLACVTGIDEGVAFLAAGDVDMVLLDNRLMPTVDFRQTAPKLREAGFTGPIGLVSSDITDDYFQAFPEFGVDFRIGKDEIDGQAISFILGEFLGNRRENEWDEDPR